MKSHHLSKSWSCFEALLERQSDWAIRDKRQQTLGGSGEIAWTVLKRPPLREALPLRFGQCAPHPGAVEIVVINECRAAGARNRLKLQRRLRQIRVRPPAVALLASLWCRRLRPARPAAQDLADDLI